MVPLDENDKISFNEIKHRVLKSYINGNAITSGYELRRNKKILNSQGLQELVDAQGIINREETMMKMLKLLIKEQQ